MSFIIIVTNFTTSKPENDIQEFLNVLKSYDSLKINESCYVIKTDIGTMELCERIKPFIEIGKDELFITKIVDPIDLLGWGYLLPLKRDFFRQ